MPYIDFEAEDDYASLWYITNSPFCNVGGFDPERPTLLLMHHTFLESDWLVNHFSDPRLNSSYNMIAFDMRVCGKSSCRPSGRHDSWVEAADIGRAHHALHLPPVHVIGFETLGCLCATRFAALFPNISLSLILCNAPPPVELKWAFNAYDEILQAWCYPEELDTLERFGAEAVSTMLGPNPDPDLEEELITYWELWMPPSTRQRIVEQVNVVLNRTPLTTAAMESIRQPVLLLHGERNHLSPISHANDLANKLVNAENGAVVYSIKGAGGSFSLSINDASIANQTINKFLNRLPKARSHINPPTQSMFQFMHEALARLAVFFGDTSMADRNPLSALSFSCLSQDVVKSQAESLAYFGKDQWAALNPLNAYGRPIRRYSQRKDEHWFQGGSDGLSYADSSLASKQTKKDKTSSPLPITNGSRVRNNLPMSTELVSKQLAEDGRVRRAAAYKQITDKQVIKGSMAKVVANPPAATSFHKLLL